MIKEQDDRIKEQDDRIKEQDDRIKEQDDRIKGQDSRINGADVEIKKEILLEVVKSRLKPVFLTTLTTVLGLVTLALKDDLW
jgi:multidrug efflux pump subunit AcrB